MAYTFDFILFLIIRLKVDRQVDALARTLLAGAYQSFYLTFQLFHLTGFFEAFLRLILAKLSGML